MSFDVNNDDVRSAAVPHLGVSLTSIVSCWQKESCEVFSHLVGFAAPSSSYAATPAPAALSMNLKWYLDRQRKKLPARCVDGSRGLGSKSLSFFQTSPDTAQNSVFQCGIRRLNTPESIASNFLIKALSPSESAVYRYSSAKSDAFNTDVSVEMDCRGFPMPSHRFVTPYSHASPQPECEDHRPSQVTEGVKHLQISDAPVTLSEGSVAPSEPPAATVEDTRRLWWATAETRTNRQSFSKCDYASVSLRQHGNLSSTTVLPRDSETRYLPQSSFVKLLRSVTNVGSFASLDDQGQDGVSAILQTLLCARGKQRGVFLTAGELNTMHLSSLDKYLFQLKQQEVQGQTFTARILYGGCAALTLVVVSFLLLALGLFCWFLSRSYVERSFPYSLGQNSLNISLVQEKRWDPQKPVYLYVDLEGFRGFHRLYISSRPAELFSGVSCAGYDTVKSFLSVRTAHTVPEFPDLPSLPSDRRVFPCGLSSFSLFNDYFMLYRERDRMPIDVDTVHISSRQHFILYASRERPPGLRIEDDWIKPTAPRYRNWLTLNPGRHTRMLLGRITEGLLPEVYTVNFTQNVWPADVWDVKKSLVLAQLSPLGSSQSTVVASAILCCQLRCAAFCACLALILQVVALGFFIFYKAGFYWVSSSVKEALGDTPPHRTTTSYNTILRERLQLIHLAWSNRYLGGNYISRRFESEKRMDQ